MIVKLNNCLALTIFVLTFTSFCNTQLLSNTLYNNSEIINDDSVIVNSLNDNPAFIKTNSSFLEWLLGLTGIGKPQSTTEKPMEPEEVVECDKTCVCGKMNNKNRIVGGDETKVNQYPWMAMLHYNNRFYCGGALINDRYIITAAHCVHGFNMSYITVIFLEHDTSLPKDNELIKRKVTKVLRHPKYDQYSYNNDIAILKLNKAIPMIDPIRPVCLAKVGKSFTNYDGIVTGWGATREGGAVSLKLQAVTIPILSNIDCKKTGYGESRITENMLCAGFVEKGGKDSCQGDSGGPLHIVSQETGAVELAGVVSWGDGCAKPNFPGVYTRANRYDMWIRSNTKEACYCDPYQK